MMQVLLVPVFFMLSAGCFAQSLKDSLFSGKLKADSALLIKSKVNVPKTGIDSVRKNKPDSLKKQEADSLVTQHIPEKPVINFRDNNKIWKKFIDQYTGVINTEVLPTRKIKRGTYTVMLDYEIGTDGVVSAKNITCTPSNEYLVEQIKERMMPNAPLLAPLVRDGVPRKSGKRQVLVFTKEKK
jgi:hypothetical protein